MVFLGTCRSSSRGKQNDATRKRNARLPQIELKPSNTPKLKVKPPTSTKIKMKPPNAAKIIIKPPNSTNDRQAAVAVNACERMGLAVPG